MKNAESFTKSNNPLPILSLEALCSKRGILHRRTHQSGNAGRRSLGVKNRDDALRRLPDLDRSIAVRLRLAEPAPLQTVSNARLSLDAGRAKYESHLPRPRAIGGTKASTRKRYRGILDKFIPFARAKEFVDWDQIDRDTIVAYLTDLERKGYAPKTLRNEVTTFVQGMRWLASTGCLLGVEVPSITLRNVESIKAYCYRPVEVQAMIAHCMTAPGLSWMASVIRGLACTSFRISELAGLRWNDVDLQAGRLSLTDEPGAGARFVSGRELKTGRSRTLPIHPELRAVLERLVRRDNLVFHGPRDGRLKPDTVRNVLIRDVIRPLAAQFPRSGARGFEEGRLHSFRHYLQLARAGKQPPGDSNAATTVSGGRQAVEEDATQAEQGPI